jgi:C4-dicarboxylate-specific signal transduction histidine kinase
LLLDLPSKPVFLDCYAAQIGQVLINLVNNWVDAIGNLRSKNGTKSQ